MQPHHALPGFHPFPSPRTGILRTLSSLLVIHPLSGAAVTEVNHRDSTTTGIEIFWIKDGRLRIATEGSIYNLSGGMICLVPPGHPRRSVIYEGVTGYYLYLSLGLLQEMDDNPAISLLYASVCCSPSPFVIKIENDLRLAQEVLGLMQCMLRDLVARDIDIIRSYLKIFLLYMSRSASLSSGVSVLPSC